MPDVPNQLELGWAVGTPSLRLLLFPSLSFVMWAPRTGARSPEQAQHFGPAKEVLGSSLRKPACERTPPGLWFSRYVHKAHGDGGHVLSSYAAWRQAPSAMAS